MTKRDKLLDKNKRRPNNVTFDELRKVLEDEGFFLDRTSGSHHVFEKDGVIFVVPSHNNRVKITYVKRVIELIEQHGES